jgi:hypothetical protein
MAVESTLWVAVVGRGWVVGGGGGGGSVGWECVQPRQPQPQSPQTQVHAIACLASGLATPHTPPHMPHVCQWHAMHDARFMHSRQKPNMRADSGGGTECSSTSAAVAQLMQQRAAQSAVTRS